MDSIKERNYTLCGFQAYDLGSIRKHVEIVHTNNVELKCPKCVFLAKSSGELMEHMTMEHSNDDQLSCNGSNTIDSSSELRNHKRKFHASTKLIKCQTCHEKFESVETLSLHIKTEHGNLDQHDKEYNCTGCSFQATELRHLRKHFELVHTLKNNFNCSRCDYIGVTSSELSKHIEQIHVTNEIKSSLFNFTKTNKSELKPHTQNDHKTQDIIRCRICGETCTSKGRLMQHRKKEHIETVAFCRKNLIGTCVFSSSGCYWNHGAQPDITKDGQLFKCYICSKAFSDKRYMMTHKKKEHIESVRYCNLFLDGKCPFKDESCWFRHLDDSKSPSTEVKNGNENIENSVFQAVQENLEPPLAQN